MGTEHQEDGIVVNQHVRIAEQTYHGNTFHPRQSKSIIISIIIISNGNNNIDTCFFFSCLTERQNLSSTDHLMAMLGREENIRGKTFLPFSLRLVK